MSFSALHAFMAKAKQKLEQLADPAASPDGVHVVLGNESCDLDSAVCALCLALALDGEGEAALPVFNIPREEFPVRTEVNYLLRAHGLPTDLVICRDDVDLAALRASGRLRLTLVDHHVLAEGDRALADCLVAVLDHRPRDAAQDFPAGCDVDVRTVGSCASLVSERILARAPHLLHDAQVADLIRATVLLDTACFAPEADRTTPTDVAAVEACERLGHIAESRAATFERVAAARKDISSLTSLQLLHKDMKVVKGLPLPGMPLLVKEFLARPDAGAALSAFCEKHHSDTAVVIGMSFPAGRLQRDLAIYSGVRGPVAEKVEKALREEDSLQLTQLPCDVPGVVLFAQNNVKQSRKQIIPVVQRVLSAV